MFVRRFFERPSPSFEHASYPTATDSTKFCAQFSWYLEQCLSTNATTTSCYAMCVHVVYSSTSLLLCTYCGLCLTICHAWNSTMAWVEGKNKSRSSRRPPWSPMACMIWWYDVTWNDILRYDMICYGMLWYVTFCYDVMICCDMVCYDILWYGAVRHRIMMCYDM